MIETAAQQIAEELIAQNAAASMQAQTPFEPVAAAPAPEPATEASLGSTILASGMLKKPARSLNDPLAPIRRMSQAEKVAFFS
jgi:hypothetical protein